MGFFDKLESRVQAVDSLLCVGLDPHSSDLEQVRSERAELTSDSEAAVWMCTRLIEETKHIAAAYKPNAAFFEALGADGFNALRQVLQAIPQDIPIVLDSKRGDISTTATAYATATFDQLKADCITLHPYMGYDSVGPFIEPDESKGAFVLCKTSNPSSSDFETSQLVEGGMLYEKVARECEKWNSKNNVGVVVGATDVQALKNVRAAAPSLWILAPGVGFQGGNLEEAAKAGLRADGMGLLVPISRGISRAESPKSAAESFRDQLNQVRKLASAGAENDQAGELEQYQKDFFELALRCGVLKFGEFTLKSGRKSPYFFNAGLFSTGSALDGLGRFYAQRIVDSQVEFDVLFGPAYKGIPLGAVIALSLSRDHGLDVPFAYNRKEAKDHGEGGVLVGASVKGKRALIVDDVITAGTAIRESITLLAKEDASVAGVVIALDRQETTSSESNQSAIQSVKEEFGFDVFPIVCLDDLLTYVQTSGELAADVLAAVKQYREQYGVSK